MQYLYFRSVILLFLGAVLVSTAAGQQLNRTFKIDAGGRVKVINPHGRVNAVTRIESNDDLQSRDIEVKAVSESGLSPSEIEFKDASGELQIEVKPDGLKKRIDISIVMPPGLRVKVETRAGEVKLAGEFLSADVRTDTGTIAADVPTGNLVYDFAWTASRPRFLSDFEIEKVKEKSAGRFEIKGRYAEDSDAETGRRGDAAGGNESVTAADPLSAGIAEKRSESKSQKSKATTLNFTTSRGIILLNIPPNEVSSDLRERPLTNAAKAIVRSGDSLLMEAIRRAAPKYFGDYTRTLPPLRLEPSFAAKSAMPDVPNVPVKTALVRVTDLRNRAISGLAANDFEVLENGIKREIVSVGRSEAPFNLVLLLDVSGSVENYVNFIRKAARSFVNTVGKNDRVSIVIFNEDVKQLSTFTTDKDKLSVSLDTFDAGGATAYYDALAYTIADTLRPLKGERTAIVILTDGDDNRSFLAFDSLMGSIQESGALIYPLYVPSGLIALAAQNLNADIDPLRKKYMSLTAKSEGEGEKLAKISGGVYYPITQIGQIQKAYEDIVIQMRSAYNITFRSDTTNGNSPRLKIRAKRDNVFTSVTTVVAAEGR